MSYLWVSVGHPPRAAGCLRGARNITNHNTIHSLPLAPNLCCHVSHTDPCFWSLLLYVVLQDRDRVYYARSSLCSFMEGVSGFCISNIGLIFLTNISTFIPVSQTREKFRQVYQLCFLFTINTVQWQYLFISTQIPVEHLKTTPGKALCISTQTTTRLPGKLLCISTQGTAPCASQHKVLPGNSRQTLVHLNTRYYRV